MADCQRCGATTGDPCNHCAGLVGNAAHQAADLVVTGLRPAPPLQMGQASLGIEFETIIWCLGAHDMLAQDEAQLMRADLWKLVSDSGRLEFVTDPQATLEGLFVAHWQIHLFLLYLQERSFSAPPGPPTKTLNLGQKALKAKPVDLNGSDFYCFKGGSVITIASGPNHEDEFKVRVLQDCGVRIRRQVPLNAVAPQDNVHRPLSRWGTPQLSVGVPLARLGAFLRAAAQVAPTTNPLAGLAAAIKSSVDLYGQNAAETDIWQWGANELQKYVQNRDKVEEIMGSTVRGELVTCLNAARTYIQGRSVPNADAAEGLIAFAALVCYFAKRHSDGGSYLKASYTLLPRTNLHSVFRQLSAEHRRLFLDYCFLSANCAGLPWVTPMYESSVSEQGRHVDLSRQAWWVSVACGELFDANGASLGPLTRTCLHDNALSRVDGLAVNYTKGHGGQVVCTPLGGTSASLGAMRAREGLCILELRHLSKSDAGVPFWVFFPHLTLPVLRAVHGGTNSQFDVTGGLHAQPPNFSTAAYHALDDIVRVSTNNVAIHNTPGHWLPLTAANTLQAQVTPGSPWQPAAAPAPALCPTHQKALPCDDC
jgi:hypothetical protein